MTLSVLIFDIGVRCSEMFLMYTLLHSPSDMAEAAATVVAVDTIEVMTIGTSLVLVGKGPLVANWEHVF